MDPNGRQDKRVVEELRHYLTRDSLLDRFDRSERRSRGVAMAVAFLSCLIVLSLFGVLLHQVWTLQNELWVLRTQCVPLPLDYDHEHP